MANMKYKKGRTEKFNIARKGCLPHRSCYAWETTVLIFTIRNEVAKVVFLQECVCPQRGTWSRGVSAPGGCLLQGGVCSGGAWSWRVPGLGGGVFAPEGCLLLGVGCLVPGGSAPRGVGIPACTEADPPPRERRLLLRTVRILLECILVFRKYPMSWQF